MSAAEPRRGEVWWIAFDPAVGGEIRKTRPAAIVSNDAANRALNRVQVVPVSSQTGKLYHTEALLTVNGQSAKADQLTTAAKERLRGRIGRLTAVEMAEVERVVRLQLGL